MGVRKADWNQLDLHTAVGSPRILAYGMAGSCADDHLGSVFMGNSSRFVEELEPSSPACDLRADPNAGSELELETACRDSFSRAGRANSQEGRTKPARNWLVRVTREHLEPRTVSGFGRREDSSTCHALHGIG